jgi:predicted dehydrogenase
VKPRVAFVGTGWIGRHRMAALLDANLIECAMMCDPDPACRNAAAERAPGAPVVASFDAVIAERPDAVVIATPSALHAGQAIAALDAGLAVFCQKPLGRSGEEVAKVVAAARSADRLLGLDLSYRHITGVQQIAALIRDGALGRVFAADLTFHNAYGPGKDWFYDRAQSGGGCLIDLGVHLVDLVLWMLDFPAVDRVAATILAGGVPANDDQVEDYAAATFDAGGTHVRLACSWRLHAGADAVFDIAIYGTAGGIRLRNIAGSFYDFAAERMTGTRTETLTRAPEDWGSRAIVDWVKRLARSPAFDPSAEQFERSAVLLDKIYASAAP